MPGYFHPPHGEVVNAVARALAEDLQPLGDMTSGMLDPTITATAQINARKPGRLAGCGCAAEAFRLESVGSPTRIQFNSKH